METHKVEWVMTFTGLCRPVGHVLAVGSSVPGFFVGSYAPMSSCTLMAEQHTMEVSHGDGKAKHAWPWRWQGQTGLYTGVRTPRHLSCHQQMPSLRSAGSPAVDDNDMPHMSLRGDVQSHWPLASHYCDSSQFGLRIFHILSKYGLKAYRPAPYKRPQAVPYANGSGSMT